jgi:hypothetical protein
MENKQTAVEWLIEKLELDMYQDLDDNTIKIIDQAKEMERNQLILFGAQCMVESEKESGLGAIRIYELYFDKTFKSEEQ